jgi:hypothetical protein
MKCVVKCGDGTVCIVVEDLKWVDIRVLPPDPPPELSVFMRGHPSVLNPYPCPSLLVSDYRVNLWLMRKTKKKKPGKFT